MFRNKIVYIAGPYRAKTRFGIWANIWRARLVAVQVWKAGFTAICPHLNSCRFEKYVPDADKIFLDGDLFLLEKCDAMLIMPNSRRSMGVANEIRFAEERGIPCVRSLDELREYFINDRDRVVAVLGIAE